MFTLTPLEIEALRLVSGCRCGRWRAAAARHPLRLAAGARPFPGKSLFDGIIHLPLVLPPVVVGYFLLVLLGTAGADRRVPARLVRHHLRLHLEGRGARLGGDGLPADGARHPPVAGSGRPRPGAGGRAPSAPARCGPSSPSPCRWRLPGRADRRDPGLRPQSLGEFGATITFVSNIPGETRTLPLALYALTQIPGGDAAALRLCVISVAVAFAALLASEILARRIGGRLQGLSRCSRSTSRRGSATSRSTSHFARRRRR